MYAQLHRFEGHLVIVSFGGVGHLRVEQHDSSFPGKTHDMNTPKVILLHVDDSSACMNHARLAHRLAERLDAEVQALYAVTPSVARHPASSLEGAWTLAQAMVELDEQQRVATKASFTAVIEQLPRVRWVDSPGDTAWEFPRRALYADLVMARPLEAQHDEVSRDFAATVAIESGKPVLVLPNDPSLQEAGTRVLIAWNPTREAARAVTAALPWLRSAGRVHLVCAGPPHPEGDAASDFSIEHYLRVQGIDVTRVPDIADTRDAAPALHTLASAVSADLLVMGCFGHSRMREWVLGGTTRSVLEALHLPVLMVH